MGETNSARVCVVAHCILNPTTRVHGVGSRDGVHPLVADLVAEGAAVVQLPCPEVGYLGMRRWVASREQYDTESFRRHARELLRPTVETLVELQRDGVCVERVVGVPGSPSCGCAQTSEGFEGGRIDAPKRSQRVPGMGILIQELDAMLQRAGITVAFEDAQDA